MGTHPIFESDFDCLTVIRNRDSLKMMIHRMGQCCRLNKRSFSKSRVFQFSSHSAQNQSDSTSDSNFLSTLTPLNPSEIEVFKPCVNELMTLEQKLEFADRFSDLVEVLQQEENALNDNFKDFIDELSTTKTRSRSTRNSKNKRRGISDNEYNLHKLHEKLKSELPLILAPSYTDHDFSIYDENVKLEIYNDSKHMVYVGLRKYTLMWNVAVKKVSVELNHPIFEIMNSKVDRKRGQIEIKWRVAGRTKLHSSLGRLIRIRDDAGLKDYRMVSTLSVDNAGKVYSHVISDMEFNTGPQVERNDLFAGVLVGLGVSGAPNTE